MPKCELPLSLFQIIHGSLRDSNFTLMILILAKKGMLAKTFGYQTKNPFQFHFHTHFPSNSKYTTHKTESSLIPKLSLTISIEGHQNTQFQITKILGLEIENTTAIPEYLRLWNEKPKWKSFSIEIENYIIFI